MNKPECFGGQDCLKIPYSCGRCCYSKECFNETFGELVNEKE